MDSSSQPPTRCCMAKGWGPTTLVASRHDRRLAPVSAANQREAVVVPLRNRRRWPSSHGADDEPAALLSKRAGARAYLGSRERHVCHVRHASSSPQQTYPAMFERLRQARARGATARARDIPTSKLGSWRGASSVFFVKANCATSPSAGGRTAIALASGAGGERRGAAMGRVQFERGSAR
jgi:hypothetical protein